MFYSVLQYVLCGRAVMSDSMSASVQFGPVNVSHMDGSHGTRQDMSHVTLKDRRHVRLWSVLSMWVIAFI